MCLGIPGRVVEMVDGHGDQLAMVDVEGVQRTINIGMLDEPRQAGDWMLIHMGFALEVVDQRQADDAIAGLEMMGQAREERTRRAMPDHDGRAVSYAGLGTRAVRAVRVPAQLPRLLRPHGPRRLLRARRLRVSTTEGSGSLSQQFAGAWPYLELIAGSLGLDDPLDRRVVDAYWVGNSRLNRVTPTAVGNSMEDRFRCHDRIVVLVPDRQRDRRRSAASQLRRLLHLPVDRAAE